MLHEESKERLCCLRERRAPCPPCPVPTELWYLPCKPDWVMVISLPPPLLSVRPEFSISADYCFNYQAQSEFSRSQRSSLPTAPLELAGMGLGGFVCCHIRCSPCRSLMLRSWSGWHQGSVAKEQAATRSPLLVPLDFAFGICPEMFVFQTWERAFGLGWVSHMQELSSSPCPAFWDRVDLTKLCRLRYQHRLWRKKQNKEKMEKWSDTME